MKNNEENDLKEFSNELRKLAKEHPVTIPLQREELSEKEIEEYWKSITDESKKKYSDALSFPPETTNEMLEITLQKRRTRKEEIFRNRSIKNKKTND